MPKKLTYAKTGVDRELRAKAKTALEMLQQTYKFSAYGGVLQLPYGNIIPIGDKYLDLVIEGIGTKVLLAQLADKYDTIGVDGAAVAVNDVIRSGARPLALADNIHAQISDPLLVKDWIEGISKGAAESRCVVTGGEIGDVPEIIKGLKESKGFDIIVACIGDVNEDRIIYGNDIKPTDVVIGIRSSGIHSNGITLARKVLFKEWGGMFDPYDIPEGLDRELVYEALEPTRIYVKPIIAVAKHHRIKGAVHITGDAYLKFNRLMDFSKGTGYEFDNFNPHPVFEIIQKAAGRLGGISDEEMFSTFNMGWGFAIVVNRNVQDEVLDILEKDKNEAEVIGKVMSTKRITVVHNGKKLILG
ncbi:MAG: phosphoribosylformylglycinamidine cyclo-ligase [Candidatus Bathyarchaeota archaeon]|nr:MAG: phosphoribosylformylglycinamidine cyclo-ligase [Candidatus Bathyarchaeota archaeon]